MTESANTEPDLPPNGEVDRTVPSQPRTQAEFAELFAGYARAARGTALRSQSKGDPFGEQLATARADVYDKAATLVRQQNLDDAVQQMLDTATRMHVRTAPLMDFDNAGMSYISSRAWQFCALTIDPSAPEVAARWD